MKIFATAAILSFATTAPAMAQVTSVQQLQDVQPTSWSYQAISNLVERYGCVAGFPDGTFKPESVATRAELAALVNSCLDQITEFYSEADARTAAALRVEFSREISATNSRVTALEIGTEAKAEGIGNYIGLGVLLNRQGVGGTGDQGVKNADSTVSGATLQGRYRLGQVFGGEYSLRPYINAAAGPSGQIGAAGGALLTYDHSVSQATLSDGSKVSRANLYGGVGYQVPFTNNVEASFQSAIGSDRYGQAVFVIGAEGRITNSLTGFADIKLPTTNSGVNGSSYSPVFTTGLGFRF